MTETFTRLKKKFTQPQQKDITKKNTSGQKRKSNFNNQQPRTNSRENKSQSREATNRSKLSRSKHSAKKVGNANPINFNISKQKLEMLNKNGSETKPEESKSLSKFINLPNINKNAENSSKIDHTLVGFATRSLSKNGSLKIKKS